MKFDPQKHQRRSIRLKDYDYTQPGAYFVTLCTWRRECLFGDVANGAVQLSPFGRIAQEQWLRLGRRFPQVDFSTYVIMPNHVHGIIVLRDTGKGAGEGDHKPDNQVPPLRPHEMPYVEIVRKSGHKKCPDRVD